MKITEAEIHSITRRFFIKNGFYVISRTPSGQEIHYRISTTESNYKIPDLICFKNSKIIIVEQKIKYDDLFSGTTSDVEKINLFLKNSDAIAEFILQMKEFDNEFNKDSIIGGFSSLLPNHSKHKLIQDKILTGIEIEDNDCTILLLQDGNIPQYFPFKSFDFKLN